MEVEYETQKHKNEIKIKDQDIVLLNQKNQLQKSGLEKASLIKRFTVGSIGLLLVILALLFYQYRNKQQINKTIMYKNELLEHLITEKEWLLKEVHHRVKNNLQTVVSLLELQSENLNDEALSAIHDSQNRIFAISLIHQKLYQSDNITSINMVSYLQELISHIKDIYNVGPAIVIQCAIAELEMDVSQAIPIGLIVNEAVNNSIKHAFNGEQKNPEIIITLKKNGEGQLVLSIADNGTGLPVNFTGNHKQGLGFKLMNGLAEDIEGRLQIESTTGTCISVSFNSSTPLYEAVKFKNQEKIGIA